MANLVEDRRFVSEEYYLNWYDAFWEVQIKVMRADARQYYTILESRNF